MRIIYEENNYRIIEQLDECFDLEDLKGDCFNPKHNPSIDIDTLKQEEIDFESLVNNEGVFGYVLEKWNPEIDKGWEHVDSCWGFVGQYNENEEKFNHYIIGELKKQIEQ